jgi:hypothetical protein
LANVFAQNRATIVIFAVFRSIKIVVVCLHTASANSTDDAPEVTDGKQPFATCGKLAPNLDESSRNTRRNRMRTSRYLGLVIALTAVGTSVTAFAESADELRDRILRQTKVVVTQLSVPAREYKGDGDPNTLEIVFLTNKSDGPSRVSDDGEVIFLYKASDNTQQQLISRAFEIRIARAAGGT